MQLLIAIDLPLCDSPSTAWHILAGSQRVISRPMLAGISAFPVWSTLCRKRKGTFVVITIGEGVERGPKRTDGDGPSPHSSPPLRSLILRLLVAKDRGKPKKTLK